MYIKLKQNYFLTLSRGNCIKISTKSFKQQTNLKFLKQISIENTTTNQKFKKKVNFFK